MISLFKVNSHDKTDFSLYKVRFCPWYFSKWFNAAFFGVVLTSVFSGILTDAPQVYVFGQMGLALSVYFSLALLANRPLLNPIQAVVILFYWWFGLGPTIISLWKYLSDESDLALYAQTSGMETLWIVSLGLVLYSIVARYTLQWFSEKKIYAKFLLPKGDNYHTEVLMIYLMMMAFSTISLALLQAFGIQGQEEVSFLGGTKTTIWWVGVVAAIGLVAPFLSSALMRALSGPWGKISLLLRIFILLILFQTIMSALYGGWKSPLVMLGAYYTVSYISRFQRLPWAIMFAGTLLLLFLIAPFVLHGRNLARATGADNSAMRTEVFSEVLSNPGGFLPKNLSDIDVAVFFRSIYTYAGEVARRNGLLEGEWRGDTILWGFEILVPRAINPDKRDMNIGNFFSQTIGADIGVFSRDDTLNNIGISIPFEVMGNYGAAAAILSFGLIGFLWTIFAVWILSPFRLSDHPLTPFMVMSTMGMEAALGHYLASLRGLLIPLFLCFVIGKLRKGRT